MSTTWVFLGLLAGRELAITVLLKHLPLKETGMIIVKDAGKAGVGLAVSIMLAFGLPALANLISGAGTQKAEPAAAAPAGSEQFRHTSLIPVQ